jgi:hypothetical protein
VPFSGKVKLPTAVCSRQHIALQNGPKKPEHRSNLAESGGLRFNAIALYLDSIHYLEHAAFQNFWPHTNQTRYPHFIILVPKAGLEPARPFGPCPLKTVCLPNFTTSANKKKLKNEK